MMTTEVIDVGTDSFIILADVIFIHQTTWELIGEKPIILNEVKGQSVV